MNVIKQQRVGKIAYAVGRKFIAVEETHACDGCVARCQQGVDKTLVKYKSMLCQQLPDCDGIIWEEV